MKRTDMQEQTEVKQAKRVGAVSHADKNTVHFFGWGNYVGDVSGGPLGEQPNPKIELDNGKVVWGCECWWGSEEKIKKMMEGKTIVEVDIDAARAAAA
jgi:hypothetical protein